MRNLRTAVALLALAAGAGGVATVGANEGGTLVGQTAPELQTKEWINSEGRNTLADMKGEVVLIDSWKTG